MPDRGDHRVEREHDVEHHDLHEHRRVGVRRRARTSRPRGPRACRGSRCVLLATRNRPPTIRTRSRPVTSLATSGTVNSGSVSPMIQERREQQQDAHDHRERRGRCGRRPACCSAGSFPTRIEMKTMLSMPRTISSAVSVRNAIQDCGSDTTPCSCSLSPAGRVAAGPHGTREPRVRARSGVARGSGAALALERLDLELRPRPGRWKSVGRRVLRRERLEVGQQRLHPRELHAAEEGRGRLARRVPRSCRGRPAARAPRRCGAPAPSRRCGRSGAWPSVDAAADHHEVLRHRLAADLAHAALEAERRRCGAGRSRSGSR